MSPSQDTMPSPGGLRALQHEIVQLKNENRELRAELHRLQRAISALRDLQDSLQSITPESDPFVLVNRILSLALESVDSENGSLLLLDDETGELVFVGVHGPYQDALQGYRLPPGEGIAGWVVAHNQPELVADVRLESRFSPIVDQVTGLSTVSLICVPLAREGEVIGALEVVNSREDGEFDQEDLDVMVLFARLAVEAVVRAEKR